MADIVLFHSVLGLRPGVTDAADKLRAAGHTVYTPDLFEGAVFHDYPESFAHLEQIGGPMGVAARAKAALDGLPAELVYAGFSLGGVPAELFAATRPGARGALLFHSAIPVEAFELSAWPAQVPVQVHYSTGDPYREQEEEIDPFARAVRASGASYEFYDYPGDGHLFTDSTLPKEYDAESARLLFERALAFLDRIDRAGEK